MHILFVLNQRNLPAQQRGEARQCFGGVMKTQNFEEGLMMVCFRTIKSALLLGFAAILLSFAGATSAQTFRGTILGTVTDSSGAAIAGAAVAVKNVHTGTSRTVSTSEDGTYSVPELPIGTYTVTVEKAGFKQGAVTGLQVEVSSQVRA